MRARAAALESIQFTRDGTERRETMTTRTRWQLFGGVGACLLVSGLLAACGGGPQGGDVNAGMEVYNRHCITCHTIGQGDRIGPDLRGVHERRNREWLVKWIDDPIEMGRSDPIGQELMAQWNNIPMADANLSGRQIEDVLAYIEHTSGGPIEAVAEEPPMVLTEAQFDEAKGIYFDRCAGCHGTLRAGATGPNIQPERTTQIGTTAIKAILNNGLPGGMPPWGVMGILSQDEIAMMASYIQQDPPDPPQLPLEDIARTWQLMVPISERPTEPQHDRDWENYFGVILRDAGQVAIIDGDTKETLAIVETGFAVHILRSSATGRYFYAIGRDGRVSLIDLWTEAPTLLAQVQTCYDARSVDGSKYEGYEDKLVIVGCYWPPQYVVLDGLTLEPKTVESVLTPAYDTDEELAEVRVASIVASHYDPYWIVSLKESGHVALVDYSQEGYPMISKIASERFLHDGGWDRKKRYFLVAANMRDQIVVVDTKEKKLVTKFETGIKPHPGRGANWLDPEYGWVNATTHLGEGRLAVYGADPEGRPEHAWKVVRSVELPTAGSLFLKTHPESDWVWMDFPLSADENLTRQVCVYSKAEAKVHKCWQPTDRGRTVHFEYNRAGDEVWVSGWDRNGSLVIFDDETLEEIHRIEGEWLVTPTGKFNVYNTAHDVY
jgi:nitrite reductase (NO-forming)/hydroxylamine reductase